MRIGVAYYPEHWPKERWAADAEHMRETGIDVVRLAEFAWAKMEPRRGQYDMDWLAKAVNVLAAHDLKVILCTPTAAPPQWLFNRHPSMVPIDREGRPWFRGSRRHACLNNRSYRRYVRRIVRELARAFAKDPNVVGWQIDNELGCHGSGRCYCDDCEQAFREWLMRRYGRIGRLNKLWGTVFWSQRFNDWHEVPAPRRTPAQAHPSLVLDYKRFTSATYRDFVSQQRETIDQYAGGKALVTTNQIGLHLDQIDQFDLGAPQDVASVDNYPVDGQNVDAVALTLDMTRSARRAPFWVLEQQAGATMIPARRGQPRPGQLRLWSMQSAARGAELIGYFRWRTCGFAQEMHWYGMLDADGTTRRRYDELKRAIAELKDKAPLWEGGRPDARVAMVLDYSAHWALEADSMTADVDYLAQFRTFYGLLRRMGLTVDMIAPGTDPSGYGLLVAPMPVIGRSGDAAAYLSYVQQGGTMLVTAPAGYRTEQNTWPAGPPPGPLAELLGVEVEEHDRLGGGLANSVSLDGTDYALRSLCCLLDLRGAEALGSYGQEYYAGRPVVTRCAHGEGRVYFLGAIAGADLYGKLIEMAASDAGLAAHPWSSETVEVIAWTAGDTGRPATFVLNHGDEIAELALTDGESRRDLLTDTDHTGAVTLEPYGVVLLDG